MTIDSEVNRKFEKVSRRINEEVEKRLSSRISRLTNNMSEAMFNAQSFLNLGI